MHFSIDRTVHTTAFDKPVVDHWLERKIAQTQNIIFIWQVIGMVWLQTRFILSSRYWEIGMLLIGSAGRMEL